MMKRALATTALIVASFLTPFALVHASNEVQTIDIQAVPSSFTPNKITLHVGQATTLHFVHTSGVHSIESDELGIPATTIAAGSDVAVTVTPKKAGTYVVHCGIVCGADHENMTLTVSVEP